MRVSYAELNAQARQLARSLLALGIRRGDRVGALLGNQPEWVALCLAASIVGAVFVPFNTWYKRAELAWTLRHCGVACLVFVDRFLKQDFGAMVRELLPGLRDGIPDATAAQQFPELRAVAALGGPVAGTPDWNRLLALGDQVPAAAVDEAGALVADDDPAFILYTSGSTSEPKGVVLEHAPLLANGRDMAVRRDIDGSDRVWLGTPLFYGLGAANALPVTLGCGATLVLQGAFEAGVALEVIERTAATVYYATGTVSRAILDHPRIDERASAV